MSMVDFVCLPGGGGERGGEGEGKQLQKCQFLNFFE